MRSNQRLRYTARYLSHIFIWPNLPITQTSPSRTPGTTWCELAPKSSIELCKYDVDTLELGIYFAQKSTCKTQEIWVRTHHELFHISCEGALALEFVIFGFPVLIGFFLAFFHPNNFALARLGRPFFQLLNLQGCMTSVFRNESHIQMLIAVPSHFANDAWKKSEQKLFSQCHCTNSREISDQPLRTPTTSHIRQHLRSSAKHVRLSCIHTCTKRECKYNVPLAKVLKALRHQFLPIMRLNRQPWRLCSPVIASCSLVIASCKSEHHGDITAVRAHHDNHNRCITG